MNRFFIVLLAIVFNAVAANATPLDERFFKAFQAKDINAMLAALEEGADPDFTPTDREDGVSYFYLPTVQAAKSGQADILAVLLEHGANLSHPTRLDGSEDAPTAWQEIQLHCQGPQFSAVREVILQHAKEVLVYRAKPNPFTTVLVEALESHLNSNVLSLLLSYCQATKRSLELPEELENLVSENKDAEMAPARVQGRGVKRKAKGEPEGSEKEARL